jgi:hypothetical protein
MAAKKNPPGNDDAGGPTDLEQKVQAAMDRGLDQPPAPLSDLRLPCS